MPVLSVDYWESKWRKSPYNDIKKVYDLFSLYVIDSGITDFHGFRYSLFGLPINRARAIEVQYAIADFTDINKHIGLTGAYGSVEFIVARLKEEIYYYRKYSIAEWHGSFEKGDVLYLDDSNSKERFNYHVKCTPDTHTIFMKDIGLTNNIRNRLDIHSLIPHTQAILEIAANRGHLRGGPIQETDDLLNLLECIKIKTGVDYFTLDYNEVINRYKRLGGPASLGDWRKQDHSNLLCDPTASDYYLTLRREQCYTKSFYSRHGIQKIHLFVEGNGTLKLDVTTPNETSFNQLQQALVEAKLPASFDYRIPFKCILLIQSINGRARLFDLPKLTQFLHVITTFDDTTGVVAREISDSLGLDGVLDNLPMDTEGTIDYVIEQQNNHRNFQPIWMLATKLQESNTVSFEQLFDLFKAISVGNPNYPMAQEHLTNLLLAHIDTSKSYIEMHEEAFPYALNSNNQILIDSVFDKLCGYQRLAIVARDIKGDADTLLRSARKIRETNQQLQESRPSIEHAVALSSVKGTFYHHAGHEITSVDVGVGSSFTA